MFLCVLRVCVYMCVSARVRVSVCVRVPVSVCGNGKFQVPELHRSCTVPGSSTDWFVGLLSCSLH